MGNTIQTGCDCTKTDTGQKRPGYLEKSQFFQNRIIVEDYTGCFGEAESLESLKSVMSDYTLYEVVCIRNKSPNVKHSYVRIIGVGEQAPNQISLEIKYSLNNSLKVKVSKNCKRVVLNNAEPEFIHKFDMTKESEVTFCAIFDSLIMNQSNPDGYFLKDTGNFGKSFYNFVRSLSK